MTNSIGNGVIYDPQAFDWDDDAFTMATHQHGIAVIVDFVYNHLGPSDLSLWQFDGWSENTKGGIYFCNDHCAQTPQYLRYIALMWMPVKKNTMGCPAQAK